MLNINFNSDIPIFLQVAEEIENAILTESFEEEAQVPSTTDISVKYKINPATALKGIGMLVEEGILYKKRGVGMFVSEGAKEKILEKRRKGFYEGYVLTLISEAKKLHITEAEIEELIRKGYENELY